MHRNQWKCCWTGPHPGGWWWWSRGDLSILWRSKSWAVEMAWNGPWISILWLICTWKVVIFHSYVSLPEGIIVGCCFFWIWRSKRIPQQSISWLPWEIPCSWNPKLLETHAGFSPNEAFFFGLVRMSPQSLAGAAGWDGLINHGRPFFGCVFGAKDTEANMPRKENLDPTFGKIGTWESTWRIRHFRR